MMVEALFFIPVAAKDSVRVGYAVRSIRKYCSHYRIYLLLDGLGGDDLAAELNGTDIRLVQAPAPSHGHWGKIWQLQCRALTASLSEPDLTAETLFIRMDADALLIRGGAVERARKIFATRPKAGQIGQTYTNVRGARFHNAGWQNYLRKILGWRGILHFLAQAMRAGDGPLAGLTAYRNFRAVLKQAASNGYVLGDLCLGGFNLMRRELVEAMKARLDVGASPFRYLPIVGDDIIMTIYTYWLDFAPIDDSSDDGICGIEVKGFRVNPFTLKERGHYALHPLKYGHNADGKTLNEAELVEALI